METESDLKINIVDENGKSHDFSEILKNNQGYECERELIDSSSYF
jgi:hypothetical protein